MNLKFNRFLLACLIFTSIAFSACGAEQNQPVVLQTALHVENTFTSVPATLTLTITPTLIPTLTETPLPTATPTFLYPLPTFPPSCGTVTLGSAGTQTVDNLENVQIQGVAILCGQIYIAPGVYPQTISVVEGMMDLDTGTFNSESADIQFYPAAGSDIWYGFLNINNSFVEVYSLSGLTMEHPKEPTFAECQSITKPYYNAHDNAPIYACVTTNLGNVSRIKVEQYDPLGYDAMALEISFITWKK